MSDTPVVEIIDLHKRYREGLWRTPSGEGVSGVNLSIGAGEVWALVGPNGAGKTTTLHCLLGLLQPDAGTVRLFGASPSIPAARARVGFASEIFFTYPHATAQRAMRFYGELSGMSGDALQTSTHALLQKLGLSASADRRAGRFSKGMTQRLGLAQSLIHDPDLVIWDEPTSGLDPEGRHHVADMLLELKQRGKTVLLSTHVLPDVERVCDHVAVIAQGKTLLQGPISELCAAGGGVSLETLYMNTVRGEAQHVG
jgi:ABC-2 type transport system ATP-binding protein